MPERGPILLECSLRDGSYAVDFQFTREDATLLTSVLAKLGFRFIEAGHGLGLGAARAGKGAMPASDEDMIRAAKSGAGDALVGAFCIPGLARLDDLDRAREAGLDFVRVGQNATMSESAHPYLERADGLGLRTAMNFMKSYAVSPGEFAERADAARDHGAQIVYLVDSTGGMLPEDAARYLDAARSRREGAFGFHGHDNLRLAVANCLAAYDHGADYLDVTLCGLGRGAGNAAAEVLAAVFAMRGVQTGLDPLAVMDAAEAVMWPLYSRLGPPDVLGTAMGFSRFHSGHLPVLLEAAARHGADPKRLIAAMGRLDPVELDPQALEREAEKLAGSDRRLAGPAGTAETAGLAGPAGTALSGFRHGDFSGGRINATLSAVGELGRALRAAAAKRPGAVAGAILAAGTGYAPGLLSAEFCHEGRNAVLGRVVFGDAGDAVAAVSALAGAVSLFLLDLSEGSLETPPGEIIARIRRETGRNVIPMDGAAVRKSHMLAVLGALSSGRESALLWGDADGLGQALLESGLFARVYFHQDIQETRDQGERKDSADGERAQLILCLMEPGEARAAALARFCDKRGLIADACPWPSASLARAAKERGRTYLRIDPGAAYDGFAVNALAALGATDKGRRE